MTKTNHTQDCISKSKASRLREVIIPLYLVLGSVFKMLCQYKGKIDKPESCGALLK